MRTYVAWTAATRTVVISVPPLGGSDLAKDRIAAFWNRTPNARRRACAAEGGNRVISFTVRLGRAQLGADELTVVPANEAPWDDLQSVFGSRGEAPLCQCQRYKLRPKEAFSKFPAEERAARLLAQTQCGNPDADATTGLVAYLDGQPVGWCAVEPRTAYPGLLRVYRVPWEGRVEDKTDDSVWAVTCVFTRSGYRRRGISRALVRAAVEFARGRGARALEGYPMLVEPSQDITWGEMHVGSRSIFVDAGFEQVSHPTPRRVVMRIYFA